MERSDLTSLQAGDVAVVGPGVGHVLGATPVYDGVAAGSVCWVSLASMRVLDARSAAKLASRSARRSTADGVGDGGVAVVIV